MNDDAPAAASWDAGGWEGARQAQVTRWRRSTPGQRLAWLEEAIAFACDACGRATTGAAEEPPNPPVRGGWAQSDERSSSA